MTTARSDDRRPLLRPHETSGLRMVGRLVDFLSPDSQIPDSQTPDRQANELTGGPTTSAEPQVWLINLYFGPGPAPTGVLLESLAIGLQEWGWDVTVLCGTADYRGEQSRNTSRFTGRIHRFHSPLGGRKLRSKFLTWLVFVVQLALFLCWRRLPGTVIVQTTPPFLQILLALRSRFSRHRCRLILWNQDTFPEALAATGLLRETSWTYRLLWRATRWSAQFVSQAVALDGAMAERLRQQGIRAVAVIPNWDVSACETSPGSLPPALLEQLHPYDHCIAYTGNLGRGHDLTPVWDYLRRHPRQTDFSLLFVGTSARTAEIQAECLREGWDCVKFWPYLPADQFAALLARADFGLVALEQNCVGIMSPSKMHAWLKAGKPIIYIGPQGSNVSDTISLFNCGWSVSPALPDGFALILETIRTSHDLSPLQAAARTAWHTRHSTSVGLAAWRQLLESNSLVNSAPHAHTALPVSDARQPSIST